MTLDKQITHNFDSANWQAEQRRKRSLAVAGENHRPGQNLHFEHKSEPIINPLEWLKTNGGTNQKG